MMDLCRTPFFHAAGQKSGPKSGSVQKSGQKSALFSGLGQHGEKPKNYTAKCPVHQNDANANYGTNRGAGLAYAVASIHRVAQFGQVRKQPPDHCNVEQDQQRHGDESHGSAFRFAQGMSAVRTFKRFFGNTGFAGWAGFGHVKSPLGWNYSTINPANVRCPAQQRWGYNA